MEKTQYELELEIANEERKIKNIKRRIESLQRTVEKKKGLIQKYWQDRFHPFRVECELPTEY